MKQDETSHPNRDELENAYKKIEKLTIENEQLTLIKTELTEVIEGLLEELNLQRAKESAEPYVKCQTCGQAYAKFEVKHAEVVLVGFCRGRPRTNCIKCVWPNQILEPLEEFKK